MLSESFSKSLNYKLRELEIIIKQLDFDNKPALIDVDLALEKTRELYEILQKIETGGHQKGLNEGTLEKQSQSKRKQVVSPDPETTDTENIFQAEEVIPDPIRKQADQFREPYGKMADSSRTDEPEKVQSSPQANKRPDDKGKADLETKKGDGKGNDEKMKKKQNGTQGIEIVADRYLTSQNYINQAMAQKKSGNDISSRSQSKPLSDLRSSIGMNDKFLFIKELFNGRPDKYNQCIDTLNQAFSLDEAIDYLKNNCKWEEDNEVAERLLNLVRRRHQSE